MSKVTLTEPTSSGWQSGIMSDVRLAAWMPATRATASTSPFLISRLAMAAVVSGFINTLHRASARRCVGSFGVTSTIRARPNGSRCVNDRSLIWTVSRAPAKLDSAAEPGRARPPKSTADLGHRALGTDEVHAVDAVARPLRADGPLDPDGQL